MPKPWFQTNIFSPQYRKMDATSKINSSIYFRFLLRTRTRTGMARESRGRINRQSRREQTPTRGICLHANYFQERTKKSDQHRGRLDFDRYFLRIHADTTAAYEGSME